MPDSISDLVGRLNALPRPPCAELTPFVVIDAQRDTGRVEVVFQPQPAFGNNFGDVQGGFAVAMVDVLLSLAVYGQRGSPHVMIASRE